MATSYDPKLIADADDLEAARAALARGGRRAKEFASLGMLYCQSSTMARLLLDAGGDPNFVTRFAGPPLPTHARAGRLEIVRLLLNRGAQPNGADMRGTALVAAVTSGHTEIARLLLQHGADIDEASRTGRSLVGHAAMEGDVELLRALATAGAPIDERCAVIHPESARRGTVVRFSTAQKAAFKGGTPLHVAAWYGQAAVAQELLALGARLEATDYLGRSPLTIARRRRNQDVTEVLVRAGAEAKTPEDADRRLVRAIRAGDLPLAREALASGARPDAELVDSVRGAPVLVLAAERGDGAAVELLLAAGARVDAQAWRHEDASMLETVAPLAARAADAIRVAGTAKRSASPSWRRGVTALDAAIHAGHVDVARVLLAAGATSGSEILAAATGRDASAVGVALAAHPSPADGVGIALVGAAAANREGAVKALLDAGVSPRGTSAGHEERIARAVLGVRGPDSALQRARRRAKRLGHPNVIETLDQIAPFVPAWLWNRRGHPPTVAQLGRYRPDRVRERMAKLARTRDSSAAATWLARVVDGKKAADATIRGVWLVTHPRRRTLDWTAIDARASRAGCIVVLLGRSAGPLAVLPCDDALDVFGLVCRAVPDSHPSVVSVLRFLHDLQAEWGVRPRRVDRHFVDLSLVRLPTVAQASAIARRIGKLCPDLPEVADPGQIHRDGRVTFWWD